MKKCFPIQKKSVKSCVKAYGWLILFLPTVSHIVHAQQSDIAAEPVESVSTQRVFSVSEQATDELVRTLYLGLGVGRSSLKPDTEALLGVGVSKGKQTGFQVTLGMDLSKWFSVELHGTDLGRAELSNNTTIGYREYGLSALFYLGGDRNRSNRRGWTVFGRTGFGHLSNQASNGVQIDNNKRQHWILGAGTEFSTRSGFALRAESIAFDTDASYLQLGLIYRLGGSQGWLSKLPGSGIGSRGLASKPGRLSGGRVPTRGDEDGDGVLQRDDKCPDTPLHVAVGENGCAVFNGLIDGLTFHSGSALLTDDALVVLGGVAASLKQIPEARARVSAHTDSQGSAEVNMSLSRQRALAVARYLIQQGIPKARLEARAFGELRPIDTNTTPAGRRFNRRVEIDLIAE